MKKRLSVALAVYNEEANIVNCLTSVKDIADEIVIVDGGSTDRTVELVKKFQVTLIQTDNPPMFHINKQKAIDASTGDWILQLDADEQVPPALGKEIVKVINMSDDELSEYEAHLPQLSLFLRHQKLIEARDKVGTSSGPYVAFYLPRLNYFLGTYLKHGGVYPDGVIRLIKKGKARLPCKDVHELMEVDGRVGWLSENLLHRDSPTFKRYLERNNRYINLMVREYREKNMQRDIVHFVDHVIIKPVWWFLLTTFRHKGILDGYQGVIFSFFSALRFPRAYLRYLSAKQ